jgi:hypothetical protein
MDGSGSHPNASELSNVPGSIAITRQPEVCDSLLLNSMEQVVSGCP